MSSRLLDTKSFNYPAGGPRNKSDSSGSVPSSPGSSSAGWNKLPALDAPRSTTGPSTALLSSTRATTTADVPIHSQGRAKDSGGPSGSQAGWGGREDVPPPPPAALSPAWGRKKKLGVATAYGDTCSWSGGGVGGGSSGGRYHVQPGASGGLVGGLGGSISPTGGRGTAGGSAKLGSGGGTRGGAEGSARLTSLAAELANAEIAARPKGGSEEAPVALSLDSLPRYKAIISSTLMAGLTPAERSKVASMALQGPARSKTFADPAALPGDGVLSHVMHVRLHSEAASEVELPAQFAEPSPKAARGGNEGSPSGFSSPKSANIGMRLKDKAQTLTLWHEEASRPQSGRIKPVHMLSSPRTLRSRTPQAMASLGTPKTVAPDGTSMGSELYPGIQPIGRLQRVVPPPELRVPERVEPSEQRTNIEKGSKGWKEKAADFAVLADSCRRLKSPDRDGDEARALLCMGVLLENAQEYGRALDSYKKYLDVCERMSDKEGQAVAHNCIGVALQQQYDAQANPTSPSRNGHELFETLSDLGEGRRAAAASAEASEVDPRTRLLELAVEAHRRHAEIAGPVGRFIAHTNLGLLLARLGAWEEAVNEHKEALACATSLGTLPEQRLAVGNLGFLLFHMRKLQAAKDCLESFLGICASLEDIVGQACAEYALGSIAMQAESFAAAGGHFEAALRAAKQCGDRFLENYARVNTGIANGRVRFAQHMAVLAEKKEELEGSLGENEHADRIGISSSRGQRQSSGGESSRASSPAVAES